jgi:hypothetical protein
MSDLQSKYADFYSYVEKIHSKQMTARYVSNRGTQHLMFGLWYVTLSSMNSITYDHIRMGA